MNNKEDKLDYNWLTGSGCVFLIGQETFGLIAAIGQFSARSPRSLAELPGFRVRQSVELKKTGTKRKYFLKWKYSKSYLNFFAAEQQDAVSELFS